MNFFKNRFRAAALLFLVAFACLVSAHVVDIRRAGRDTQFTYNGVTYTFRAQINSSPNGVYGSASAKSSSPLQAGNLGILAYIYDISGKIVQTSDIIYNPNHHSTALSATDAITAQALTIAARQSSYMTLLSGTISADMQTAMQNFLRFPLRQHQPFRRKALIR